MTVRTWVTISVLTLVALFAAVAVKVFMPLRAPELIAVVGRTRLEGVPRGACWPQRSGELRCDRGSREAGKLASIPASGTLHVVAAYPVQPKEGSFRITRGAERVVDSPWTDDLPYDLPAGHYVLRAEARYDRGAHVRYDFAFRTR